MPHYDATIDTPFARLGIVMHAGRLARIAFLDDEPAVAPKDAAAREVCDQLRDYCDAKTRHQYTLRFDLEGTAFQKKVWDTLCAIPFGTVRTYGDVACELGTSARAVGNACRRNPVPFVIPCHRVVSSQGIGGYAGNVTGPFRIIKERLLRHEGINPS